MKTESIIEMMKVYDGNLKNLKQLTINRFNIVGEIIEVDLKDLLNFPNLEILTLKNLSISENDINCMLLLTNLARLELINCELEDINDLLKDISVNELVLDNTVVNEKIFNNRFNYLKFKNMPVKYSNIDAEILDVHQNIIDVAEINYKNVSTLILSEKQYIENEVFIKEKYIGKKIVVKNEYEEAVNEYEIV